MSAESLLTLAAILLSPTIAVGVTLWSQSREKLRDSQRQTMRMLVATRHLPGDAAYTTAINMIPLDFAKNTPIMNAWREYIALINPKEEGGEAPSNDEVVSKQGDLIFLILKELGYKLTKEEITSSAYAATGFVNRDNLMLSGWQAWDRIAAALEAQNQYFLSQGNTEN